MSILNHPFIKIPIRFNAIHINCNGVEIIFDRMEYSSADTLSYTKPYSFYYKIKPIPDSEMYYVMAQNGRFEISEEEARIITEQLAILYSGAFEHYGDETIITHYDLSRVCIERAMFNDIIFNIIDLHKFPSMDIVHECKEELMRINTKFKSKIILANFDDTEEYDLSIVKLGDDIYLDYYNDIMQLDEYEELLKHIELMTVHPETNELLGEFDKEIDPDIYFRNLKIYHRGKQTKRVQNP